MARKAVDVSARRRVQAAGPVSVASGRIAVLDAFRGSAVIAMIAYHFCFDLRYFRLARFDFEHDAFWLGARAVILSSFLFAAGISVALALHRDPSGRRYWRHVAIIAASALAVSVASYVMFPRTYIWFGVLHAIAVSLALAWPLGRHPRVALAFGVAVLVAGLAMSHPAFDSRALGWIGFMTSKPSTEDYVPLFPWAGVLFIGVAAAPWLVGADAGPLRSHPASLVLQWLGRHSLLVYLLHQPLMIGVLALVVR